MKEEILALAEQYPEVLQLHGFYVDTENMRVSFDLITDFKVEDSEKILREIIETLSVRYPIYQFDVNLDTDFSD